MTAPTATHGLLWAAASAAKRGNRPDENEDALAADPPARRFAVSDGASEGWQSRAWAERLAAAFVRRPPAPADFPTWLASARAGWSPPPAAKAGPAAWYAEQKAEQGSFATLLGLELLPATSGPGLKWKALAVGDSCLMVVRGGALAQSFPVETAAGFSNRPPLVPSPADHPTPPPEWLAGRAEPGDLLVLATDGAAAWLLAAATPPWAAVTAALHESDPTARTEQLLVLLRESQVRHNDDATLIAVLVPSPGRESRP